MFEDCDLDVLEQFENLIEEDIPKKEMEKLEEWQEHAFRFMSVIDYAPNR